jgi:hypothetical protein
MIDESSVVVAADHQTSTEVDGESVILDLEEGIYYGLNPSGACIWSEIQEPVKVKEVVNKISDEYDMGAEMCHNDVISFLQSLQSEGLIRVKKD